MPRTIKPRINPPIQWLSVSQAADYLGVSYNTVRKMVRLGELKGYKLRSNYRFTEADLKAFIESSVLNSGEKSLEQANN